ncbi:PREDICTED: vesicle-associated membrane protein 4-like [Acropora digitifera]|uniref:vesicle-associated membrane protein 4-like n=1 Tax=Acropora digitifera TaxID=70779 RepID=UPI00077AE795|nr:PREDICTED: vesicle-associated membrane protein 4-like [Acropora digitifera]
MPPKFSRVNGDDRNLARSSERVSLLDDSDGEDGSNIFAAPDKFNHIKPQPSMKDGIAKVKSEIQGVMGVMQNNISKVLDRGAKLEDLQDKSGIGQLKLIFALILVIILIIIIVPIVVKSKSNDQSR